MMLRRFALKIDDQGGATYYIGKEYRMFRSIPEWVDGWMGWRYAKDFIQKDKVQRMDQFKGNPPARTYTIIELERKKGW